MGGTQGHWLFDKQDRVTVFTCNTTIWGDSKKLFSMDKNNLQTPIIRKIEISVKYPKANVD